MTFRKILFWMHLPAGLTAGIVIMIMSVTGLLLTYERQILIWADRAFWSAPPSPNATRLPIETLLANTRSALNSLPSTVTVRADPSAPVEAGFGRERIVYVNPYSGAVLGEGSKQPRAFFHSVTDWHRWLATSVQGRATGRAITGASNLLFLLLVVSGLYLWLPRKWSWQRLKPVLLFRGGLSGKARDFNWHNVFGFWACVPLFFIVLTGVVMSYPWANNLLYRMTGSELPVPVGRGPGGGPGGGVAQGGGGERREAERPRRQEGEKRGEGKRKGDGPQGGEMARLAAAPPADLSLEGFDTLWSVAEQQMPGWQSISLRLPATGRGPVTFSIDRGNGGQPEKRAQLTLNRRTGEVVRWETFDTYNLGRRLRSWGRFAHTGEVGGVVGQTIAGVASGAGAFLVWTGMALSWRRFRSWRSRKMQKTIDMEVMV
jgi:uncharacterized iron-regulated membrane protein